MAISSIYAGKLERELEIVKAERDELQKEYETLIMEKAELSKNYTQIGENLSYYIDLADRYYHEGEKLRGEKKILKTLKEDAETRATIWREKYENLKNEMENVADFFAKYERRVI